MPNEWITHVQRYRSKNPQLSYRECLQNAKGTYKKGGSVAAVSGAVGSVFDFGTALTKQLGSETAKRRRVVKQYNNFKKKMKKGKFPQMTDEDLWKYVNII